MSLVCRSCRYTVVCNDRCPPQLQFINKVVIFLFVAQEADSHGLTVQADHRDSPIDAHTVVDVPVALVVQIPLSLQFHVVHTAHRTMGTSQLRVDMVVGGRCPYLQVVRVPQVPSWRRQLCSHSCTCSVTRYVQLRAAGKTFQGSVHRYRAGGRVHRDTAPTIRCFVMWFGQTHIINILSEPPTTHHPPPTTHHTPHTDTTPHHTTPHHTTPHHTTPHHTTPPLVARGVQECWVISGRCLHGYAPCIWQSLVCLSCPWCLAASGKCRCIQRLAWSV